MFDELKVPSVAFIENMARHHCPQCSHESRPFGPAKSGEMTRQFGIKNSYELPLDPAVAALSDRGTPPVCVVPEGHPLARSFRQISAELIEEIRRLQKDSEQFHFHYDTTTGRVVLQKGKAVFKVPAKVLREACRCALCVDEFTNSVVRKEIEEGVFPTSLTRKGNYAVAVTWSDGHRSSVYPIERIIGEIAKVKEEI